MEEPLNEDLVEAISNHNPLHTTELVLDDLDVPSLSVLANPELGLHTLENFVNLYHLSLENCRFKMQSESFPKLLKLKRLNLSNNLCTGSDLNGLLTLPSLAYLDISNNPINGLKALACLQKCTTLRHLVLQNNDSTSGNGNGSDGKPPETTTSINGKLVDRKSVFDLLPQLISIDGMNRGGKMVDEEDEEDVEEDEEAEDDDGYDKRQLQTSDTSRPTGVRSKGKGRSKGKTPRSKQPYAYKVPINDDDEEEEEEEYDEDEEYDEESPVAPSGGLGKMTRKGKGKKGSKGLKGLTFQDEEDDEEDEVEYDEITAPHNYSQNGDKSGYYDEDEEDEDDYEDEEVLFTRNPSRTAGDNPQNAYPDDYEEEEEDEEEDYDEGEEEDEEEEDEEEDFDQEAYDEEDPLQEYDEDELDEEDEDGVYSGYEEDGQQDIQYYMSPTDQMHSTPGPKLSDKLSMQTPGDHGNVKQAYLISPHSNTFITPFTKRKRSEMEEVAQDNNNNGKKFSQEDPSSINFQYLNQINDQEYNIEEASSAPVKTKSIEEFKYDELEEQEIFSYNTEDQSHQ